MPGQLLRVGLIGAGANTKKRHIPGLRAVPGVEIVAVCNRRLQSTVAVAKEFGIPRFYEHWQELIDSPELDAVVIGTWPYLHCPITLAALEAGKHVLSEARMALTAAEAHRMLAAAGNHPHLVTQLVPSPYGLKGHEVMKELIESGLLGQLREIHVWSMNAGLASAAAPLGWRQDAALSGYNMLTLGIVYETLLRWVPAAVRVLAQAHAFVATRIDPESGVRRPVGTPDSVQVLTVHDDGARGIFQFSAVTPFGAGMGVRLYGSNGTIVCDLEADTIHAARIGEPSLKPIPVPPERAREWRVEADFVDAIREGTPVELTDLATGVQYMEFTEAVARSAQSGGPVELPLAEFRGENDEESPTGDQAGP